MKQLRSAHWLGLCLLARLLPHPANATPFFALMTLAIYHSRVRIAAYYFIGINMLADIILGVWYQQPGLGGLKRVQGRGLKKCNWSKLHEIRIDNNG